MENLGTIAHLNSLCSVSRRRIILFKLVLILFTSTYLDAQSRAALDTANIKPVQFSEIAKVSATDIQLIKKLLEKQVQINAVSELDPIVDSLEANTNRLKELSDQLLNYQITYQFYSTLILRWNTLDHDTEDPIAELKDHSSSLQNIINSMNSNTLKWQLTMEQTNSKDLSLDLDHRMTSVLQFIDSARTIVKDSLALSVLLLNRVTDLELVSSEYLKRLEELKNLEVSKLILQREPAIWKLKSDKDSLIKQDQHAIIYLGLEDSKIYLQEEWKTVIALLIAFLLLLLLVNWLRKIHEPDREFDDPNASIREFILSRSATTAFMLTLILSLWWLPERPAILTQLFQLIFLLPFIVLFRGLVEKSYRLGLYLFVVIYLYSTSLYFVHLGTISETISNISQSIALVIILIWMIRWSRKSKSKKTADVFMARFYNRAGPIFMIGLIIAFSSAIFGFNNFSGVLSTGVLFTILVALVFGLAYLCVITLMYFFIQTSYAERSLILKEKKRLIYNWFRKTLRLAVIVAWIYFTLKKFYLWTPVSEGLVTMWHTGYQFGALNVTIGGIISFALILYLSWLVSYIIRMMLEIEIFGRFDLPRGVPMAVSSLTQYFLIVLGFMLAMSKLGFDLKNLSILAGALGVGIGFGLQNTVNNFISGLILAFERPVTVGDIVNVAGHEGEVKRIGIRASTIKQWDGSEVIVPNADLISQKVINWTLTRYTRRSILTIHTHLDTDPDLVLEKMTQAAAKVKDILKDPEAKAYFHGVKDKHLEFALFYWASKNILDCRSQVNLEVQKALKNEGIKFQMPVPVEIKESKSPISES